MIIVKRSHIKTEKEDPVIKTVAELLLEKENVVFLTGAGISVPSGIPDFRSKDGLWSKYDPDEYASMEAFMKNPDKVWKMFWDALKLRKKVKPNPAHYAIAEIEKIRKERQKSTSIITQNVDGLHQRAGTINVIELHGSAYRARCVACRSSYYIDIIEKHYGTKKAPKCEMCGGFLKLDVTLFGEFIEPIIMEKCKKALQGMDAIVAAGTSLEVYPASDFYMKNNAVKIFINKDKPEGDIPADYVITGRIEKILPKIASEIRELSGNVRRTK